MGFLRIGSLNVRVKKTTEAFSNFLGVGGSSSINTVDAPEKMHKYWGSADNITQVCTFNTSQCLVLQCFITCSTAERHRWDILYIEFYVHVGQCVVQSSFCLYCRKAECQLLKDTSVNVNQKGTLSPSGRIVHRLLLSKLLVASITRPIPKILIPTLPQALIPTGTLSPVVYLLNVLNLFHFIHHCVNSHFEISRSMFF